MFQKVLIANRGEIAIRIIRACRQMGIDDVVVYSDVDAGAMHVRVANEAYNIGPAPANQSYLRGDKLIEVAQQCGADAIHPGYGFLAENWQFAQAVTDAGLTFIGPPAEAIRSLGDKLEARQLMEAAGVPTVPGGPVDPTDFKSAAKLAAKCGYPVLVKAVAGGGGKGMRVVEREADLAAALQRAGSEAKSAFGDDRVYLEKYLVKPRHIEVQIACDKQGNAVYLGEREGSIQRRHQKLIEEAPSVAVDEKLRQQMGKIAVTGALAAGYANIGTVEFLVDQKKNFYFLEVNTRLQVEHPVTELVTGIDLVREQINLAAGKPLSFAQDDIKISGHAIECRICAEDPESDFMPSTGELVSYREPSGPGVRVDSGVRQGSAVTPYYDPLVAKLITYGADREEAIKRMLSALSEYGICGVTTTIGFHDSVLRLDSFLKGELSTAFIPEHFPDGFVNAPLTGDDSRAVAVAAALFHFHESRRLRQIKPDKSGSHWLTQARRAGIEKLPGGRW
ncbi:MAG: acetyl-CoA carboxylase biotin carboxylase subunit [bacterium]